MPTLKPLTPAEARVLGTLMEKARTVPDSYPLSLNSLVLGCNQKTSRDPYMELSDAQAQETLDALKLLSLVLEAAGSRVTRYEHNFQRAVGVPEQSAVLLGLLMLRGPQTVAELRTNSERWYKFADNSSVEAFLVELQERAEDKGGPLVQLLPRAPGAREQRWAHLLSGPILQANTPKIHAEYAQQAIDFVADSMAPRERVEWMARIAKLEAQVDSLQQSMNKLCQELGLPQPEQA